jgi:ApbE superfamily uncharacterized protein (UPF0280 family)
MTAAAQLERVYVNDGGDIAVFAAEGHALDVGVAGEFSRGAAPALNGSIRIAPGSGIGGIATSGARGRSLSLGIADSVTVLAQNAAVADVAATLIANAVNVESAAVERRPARALDPDSDLGDHLVTVSVGQLTSAEIGAALAAGLSRASEYHRRGLILDAALALSGETRTLAAAIPAVSSSPDASFPSRVRNSPRVQRDVRMGPG